MDRDDERREFFRITDRLPVEFRIISREEFVELQDAIRYNSTQVMDRTHELYFLDIHHRPENENDHVYNYMQMINKKLDMIIELLGSSDSGGNYKKVHTDVSISGAGIKFICDTPVNEGDFVELKIIVPVSPYPKITTLCQVVRSEGDREAKEGDKRVAMKFLVINETDRDVLINYIFLKEREYLRQKKESTS